MRLAIILLVICYSVAFAISAVFIWQDHLWLGVVDAVFALLAALSAGVDMGSP